MQAPAGGDLRTEAAAMRQLDRHERRREGGVPVLSALVGPVEAAAALVCRWAEARGRPVVEREDRALAGAAEAWVERLAHVRDLRGDAAAWLALRTGHDPAHLGARLLRMTGHERALWLDRILPPPAGEEAAACRWLLEQDAPLPPAALAAELAGRLASGGAGPAPVFTAVRRLVEAGRDPVLLVPVGADDLGADAAARVGSAARHLAGLAEAEPGLTLILAVSRPDFEQYDRLAPDDRVKALIRGSVVAVPAPGPVGPGAAPASAAPTDPDPDDPARSAAERFLYERLQAHPATAGLFQLNADPGLRFGADRPMEVDLLAASLRLAVEIDGYHHFHDPEAYRRDRRKDLLLQTGGFLVVRVLADDVVARLEDVLATIVAAVASRRGPGETQTQGDPSA